VITVSGSARTVPMSHIDKPKVKLCTGKTFRQLERLWWPFNNVCDISGTLSYDDACGFFWL